MTLNKYPNTPEKIVPDELPAQFSVMKYRDNKAHIAHTNMVNKYEDKTPKHKAFCFCGRTSGGLRHGPLFITSICKDCLDILDDKMENAMYDQKAEEYYLPQEK